MSILRLENLTKTFGGLLATDNVSLHVEAGERVGIIGPNGAGKTTLFNQISGHLRPDSGKVFYDGRDITGFAPHKIVQLGIGRAFQRSNIFPRLTTFENLQAAVISQHGQSLNFWQSTKTLKVVNEQAEHILSIIGLNDKRRERMAGKLALGDQKRLEIGLALAMQPRLLLLDEPTAGMSSAETESTVKLVSEITKEFGMSLLFTEHDMAVVFGMSERIYVLNQGQIIAEGSPQEIAANPRVQEVYLGTNSNQVHLMEEK